jgi:uncharacterized repeat protein (TIGR03803 family)
VVLDAAGNLYGTTEVTPPDCDNGNGPSPFGVVYELDPGGKLTVLYRFPGPPELLNNVDTGPNPGVILDSTGNVYGATPYSGVGGVVYELVPASGLQTTLYSFPGAPGGTEPIAGLARDSAGNFYGAARSGGTLNQGTVYKLDAAGHETVLHTFAGGSDGADPESAVVLDAAGNVYGTTVGGGVANVGVVYKVDTSGQETVLYSFTGGADGGTPNGVIVDAAGNLYGTTLFGGAGGVTGIQEGVVFKLDPTGQETVLHSFTGLSDGGEPKAGVILDPAGNLYGTTTVGGIGLGVIYKLAPSGGETVLYTFAGGADGGNPYGGLIFDPAGNLFGTAAGGGELGGGGPGEGVVFELDADGQYSVLYTFTGGADGGGPEAGVVRDSAGNLYGTTSYGGGTGCLTGCGVVYKVSPSGKETVLHAFAGGADGESPEAGVILDAAGGLYGTTPWGGKGGAVGVLFSGAGVVYEIAPQ